MEDNDWDDDIYEETKLGYKWCVAQWGDEPEIFDEDTEELRDQALVDLLKSFSFGVGMKFGGCPYQV